MKKLEFKFCFKGNRDYVHGTDIYNESVKKLVELSPELITEIDFSIHKISHNDLAGYLTENESSFHGESIAKFQFMQGAQKRVLYFIETQDKINCSYEYPEEDIVKASEYDPQKKMILLKENLPFTTIEKIVAMNKALLQSLFEDAPGKWYFTKLKVARQLSESVVDIKLVFRKNLRFKLTQTEIFLGEEDIGQIFFSLV